MGIFWLVPSSLHSVRQCLGRGWTWSLRNAGQLRPLTMSDDARRRAEDALTMCLDVPENGCSGSEERLKTTLLHSSWTPFRWPFRGNAAYLWAVAPCADSDCGLLRSRVSNSNDNFRYGDFLVRRRKTTSKSHFYQSARACDLKADHRFRFLFFGTAPPQTEQVSFLAF